MYLDTFHEQKSLEPPDNYDNYETLIFKKKEKDVFLSQLNLLNHRPAIHEW